ncbi:hypothetical protein NXF25_011465 [Crotalus adamanteus]|uniref:Reverse transcriptase RNase H-like domain-containing protein n=1 Tax=Crotalus adamanteus TaxID=8729 RepID=A0AAW1BG62_CROAD
MMLKGSIFREPNRITLTTDASLFGWGAHLGTQIAQGQWDQKDLSHNINWLELRAIHLALRQFSHIVTGRHVLVLTDNVAAKAHVNKEAGTQSSELMQEASALARWAEANVSSIRAEHISGETNTQADSLSRAKVDQAEWRLDPALFEEISRRFGQSHLDLFATPKNTQLPRFFSRFPTPGSEGTDALRCQWPVQLLYAFPPLPLIPATIRKLILEGAEVILIAPHWPRRPWFADLVDLSISPPWRIPPDRVILSQGKLLHPDPQWLQLAAWHLSGKV